MNINELTDSILDRDNIGYWTSMEHKGFERYVYGKDVNLYILSHHADDVSVEEFGEAWATKHSNKSATSYNYNIFYGASLVKYVTLVSVDGGRAMLPLPNIETLTPRLFDLRVAQIVRGSSLDEYMERSGLNYPEGA